MQCHTHTTMPSLTIQEVRKYSPFQTDVFIETGTYNGDTVNEVKDHYTSVFSIELQENYARNARKRFMNDRNVSIITGDSSEQLIPICQSIKSPAFFWLDGHWSGGDTAKGAKDCPLLEELQHIVHYCAPKCIIAIDDVRLFGKKLNEDWTQITIEAVLQIVSNRLHSYQLYPSYLHPMDRLVLVLN